MADKLMTFLIELASDPERMRRYAADPAAEIRNAGLSSRDSAALIAGDVRRLRQALKASPVDHMTTMGGGGGDGGPPGHGRPPGKPPYGRKRAAKKSAAKKTAKKSKRTTKKK